mgnify:CR=1 FL=1|tara:strand:+ start:7176 stop:8162 length:987 start_codon:yes stop_codon:yes gene_type:complete
MTSPTHERVRPCTDLQAALDEELQVPGTRLHSIFPADAPRIATIEREGEWTRLDASPGAVAGEVARTAEPDVLVPGIQPDLVHVPFEDGPDAWTRGRAGMKYRDLIPGRLGGHVIASHIRIEEGGPVPDAVHHHAVRYQLIVCVRGWVRVVYEDQGEPFEMRAGDAVLQPPGIRHRVLESSPGLEVVEVACPAEHRTTIDHALTLPTPIIDPTRDFGGQRFVRHVAAKSAWSPAEVTGLEQRDLGLGAASNGTVRGRVLRLVEPLGNPTERIGDLRILFVLQGSVRVRLQDRTIDLTDGDALTIPSRTTYAWSDASTDMEVLEISAAS